MARKKITVVGAGNVGATAAFLTAMHRLGDVVLLDIVEGLAEGKALDMSQAGSVEGYDCRITGTTDWSVAANSDIVIITSGLARKPGMSRDDLLVKNTEILTSVTEQVREHCPESVIIVVSNPLDAMVHVAAKVSKFPTNRVMGMAGALDFARLAHFISLELSCSKDDIRGVLMGGHGDDMVPLASYTTVCGVPLSNLLPSERIEALFKRTRMGGIEVVNLLGTSAYYAPAAGAVKMAEAILQDRKTTVSCCAYCDAEYGAGGVFVGVPVVLGAVGVEKVLELELSADERKAFEASLAHVKELVAKVDSL